MVQHRFITGVDNHEPIGIENAIAGQVYVANGASSGSWQAVNSPIPGAIFEDQKAAGTNAGTFTSGADRTRTINTSVRNVITGASLASDQITLPAGTYYVGWWVTAYLCNNHISWLYNVTDASVVSVGSSQRTHKDDGTGGMSIGSAVFTIASTKVFEIRNRCSETRTTDGLGIATNLGQTEKYCQVKIWKEI